MSKKTEMHGAGERLDAVTPATDTKYISSEQQVLTLLEQGELPISKIAHVLGLHLYRAQDVLRDLALKKLVVCRINNRATYWRLMK